MISFILFSFVFLVCVYNMCPRVDPLLKCLLFKILHIKKKKKKKKEFGLDFCLCLLFPTLINNCLLFYSLKSREPEFLVATPERLLELISLKAIDISGVSLLVSILPFS